MTVNTPNNFWGSFLGLGDSLTVAPSSVLDQGVKDTQGVSSAALGSSILNSNSSVVSSEWKGSLDRELVKLEYSGRKRKEKGEQ